VVFICRYLDLLWSFISAPWFISTEIYDKHMCSTIHRWRFPLILVGQNMHKEWFPKSFPSNQPQNYYGYFASNKETYLT